MDETENLIKVDTFFEGGEKMTALAVHPKNGCLYYLSYPDGLYRICFGGNLPPKAVIEADKIYGPSPLTVQLDASASFDTDEPLSYFWDFGDGTNSTNVAPLHTFQNNTAQPKAIEVQLSVTDSLGASTTTTQLISLDNTPPQVSILSLKEGDRFPTDASHLIPLRAEVSDAEHSEEELVYTWETYLHHNTHFHAVQNFDTKNAFLITSPVGCDGTDYWYRIVLTVTDGAGLTGQDEITIFPNCNNNFVIFNPLSTFAMETAVELNWQTILEQNISEFRIERSSNGFDFETIGAVTPQGNNKNYQFLDNQPLEGLNQYRILAISETRALAYSNISIAFFPPNQNVYVYPNPSNGIFQLEVLKTFDTKIELDIFNGSGAKVEDYKWETGLEEHFIKTLDWSGWANGVYFYVLKNGREEVKGQLVVLK